MAGLEKVISEEVRKDNVTGSESKKKEVPSSYFVTEFNVSSKKNDENRQVNKGDGRKSFEEGTSRKVTVNLTSQGSEKKTEVSVFSGRKKAESRAQSDRNIVGQEESPPKERKKWRRPPVVGQAANIDTPSLVAPSQQTSSDSELDNKTRRLHLSLGKATTYFDPFAFDKDCQDYKSKDEVPTTPDSADCQRASSPASASSLTSRPLEWDSGADVGYNFISDHNDMRISTIEKLALTHGKTMIFKRSDPEGTTGNNIPIINTVVNLKIAPPVAESTPKNQEQKSDSDSELGKQGSSKFDSNPPPLFPHVMIKTIGEISDESLSPELLRRSKTQGNNQEEENIKKLSSISLEEVGLDHREDVQVESKVPRSRSQSNLAEENVKSHPQRLLDSAKSRSSSSVSTVVNKKSSDKSQGYSSRSKASDGTNRDSDDNQMCLNPEIPIQEDNVSRQTSPQGTDRFNTLDSNPLTGEARVNSFEYLPGHVYENSVAKVDSDSSSQQSDVWDGVGVSSTLKEEVERGANLLADFIRSSRANEDTQLKKQLIKRVVQKLIDSDNLSLKSTRSSRREDDMMMEYRGQISGESSTEKSDVNQSVPIKANKCVGTGISTSLSGYTETSDWNSATESSKKSTSDAGRFIRRSPRKANKLTQVSSRDSPEVNGHPPVEKRDCLKSKAEDRKKKGSEEEMLKYLKKERRNQLDWIKSEIDHLSNLKKLLEKHEVLKRNLDHLKRNQKTLEIPIKSYSEQLDSRRRAKFKREDRGFSSATVNGLKYGPKTNSSGSSCLKDSGWTSHHYETDDERRLRKENMKPMISSLKRSPMRSMSNPLPGSTSYTITFPSLSEDKVRRCGRDDDVLLSVGELKSAIDSIVEKHRKPTPVPSIYPIPTLKECLETERPDFVEKAEARRQILSEIVELRQERQTNKQQVIAAAASDVPGPRPPLAVKRVFSQKNLRKQTERKYKQLAEVRCKKAELKRKESYRTNRLMADIFNKKLQRRTLQGQVNLSNSVCVTDPIK